MINGHLSEAHHGFAVLEDVNKEVFVRFIRWTYSKDYPAIEHTVVKQETVENPEAKSSATTGDPDDDWSFWTGTKKDKKKKKKAEGERGTLKESFISRHYELDRTWNASSPPAPRGNKAADESYTEVFLCHARMYVFAEKYDIQPLKQLALKKLQETLAIYTLYPERVEDVLTLLKYVYANTSESDPEQEDIRTMLAHYIGCEMEILVKDGEIKDLFSENEEMLNDFLHMFAQRIS